MEPWAHMVLDPDWTWSYLGPKISFWEIDVSIWAKRGADEAESIPGPYGSPPGAQSADFETKIQKLIINLKES